MEKTLTDKMRIDVLSLIKEKNMSNKFPQINKWKPYLLYMEKPLQRLPFRETFAYIFLLYSNDSILNKEPMPPLHERQAQAADLVGFRKTKGGDFSIEVQDILFNLNHQILVDLVFHFLIYQGDKEWHEIVTSEKLRQSYLKNLLSPVEHEDPKKVSDTLMVHGKLYDNIESINKRLKIKYKEMFGDVERLTNYASKEIQMATIESYAE